MEWWALLKDTALDCLRMLPFLFLAYLAIETIEHSHSQRMQRLLAGNGRWGFALGSLLGLAPQCGFSAMAADLYAARVITPGTLLAVFVATSDEALPLLLAAGEGRGALRLLAYKGLWGLACGFVVDRLAVRRQWGGFSGSAADCDCHDHRETERVLPAALRHTAQVFALVFAASLALGALLQWCGGGLRSALAGVGLWQVPLAAAVGLVPNCAVSVALLELYADGLIGFGALFGGLCAGAGLGLLVLWRADPSRRECLRLTGLLYLCAVAGGWLAQWLA